MDFWFVLFPPPPKIGKFTNFSESLNVLHSRLKIEKLYSFFYLSDCSILYAQVAPITSNQFMFPRRMVTDIPASTDNTYG